MYTHPKLLNQAPMLYTSQPPRLVLNYLSCSHPNTVHLWEALPCMRAIINQCVYWRITLSKLCSLILLIQQFSGTLSNANANKQPDLCFDVPCVSLVQGIQGYDLFTLPNDPNAFAWCFGYHRSTKVSICLIYVSCLSHAFTFRARRSQCQEHVSITLPSCWHMSCKVISELSGVKVNLAHIAMRFLFKLSIGIPWQFFAEALPGCSKVPTSRIRSFLSLLQIKMNFCNAEICQLALGWTFETCGHLKVVTYKLMSSKPRWLWALKCLHGLGDREGKPPWEAIFVSEIILRSSLFSACIHCPGRMELAYRSWRRFYITILLTKICTERSFAMCIMSLTLCKSSASIILKIFDRESISIYQWEKS